MVDNKFVLGYMAGDIVKMNTNDKVGIITGITGEEENEIARIVYTDGEIDDSVVLHDTMYNMTLISGYDMADDYEDVYKKYFGSKVIDVDWSVTTSSDDDIGAIDILSDYDDFSYMSMGGYVPHKHHILQPVAVGSMQLFLSSAGMLSAAELKKAPFTADLFVCLEHRALPGTDLYFNTPLDTVEESEYQSTIYLDWPDFGVVDLDVLHRLVSVVVKELESGKRIEIGCMAGHGRTGTLTACVMSVVEHTDPYTTIKNLRARYCNDAVDTSKQIQLVVDYWRKYIKLPEDKDVKDVSKATTTTFTTGKTVFSTTDEEIHGKVFPLDKSLQVPNGFKGKIDNYTGANSGVHVTLDWKKSDVTTAVIERAIGSEDFITIAERQYGFFIDWSSIPKDIEGKILKYRIRTLYKGKVSAPSKIIELKWPKGGSDK